MKNAQPNFEMLKTVFYNYFIKTWEVDFAVLTESFTGVLLPSFHKRKEVFERDFNKWLDSLDIRQAGALVDAMNQSGKSIPSWLKSKRYTIDYNENGSLDLLIVKH